jgi:hypothetical protein
MKAYELLKEQCKAIAEADVVTHIACARVDIFDHYEITVSWPVGERYGGKAVMCAGAWA